MILPKVILVTGTDTGVGKTIATAALATALAAAPAAAALAAAPPSGRHLHGAVSQRGVDLHGPAGPTAAGIAAYKPVQTGVDDGEPGDMAEVRRLAGLETVVEGARLRAPMAPVQAAALEGRQLPCLDEHIERVHSLAAGHRHVLVEGAGGLLVELDSSGATLADLAAALGGLGGVVVIARAGLGTLNHTLLTLEALHHRAVPVAGTAIGSWPQQPGAVERANMDHLASLPVPFLGALPARASDMDPEQFRIGAPVWLESVD